MNSERTRELLTDERKVEEFLEFIKDSDPSVVAELITAKGIHVDKVKFICQMTLLKAEICIAKSFAFLKKTREQTLVSGFISDVVDKPAYSCSKTRDFTVAELEICYKRKKKSRLIIDGANIAYSVFMEMWDESLINIQEQLCALYLDHTGSVIGYRLLSTGTGKNCPVDYNLLVSFALLSRASVIILAHNHPSGNLQFSKADIDITIAAQGMLRQFGIKVLDHLIISNEGYASMKDNKALTFN